MRTATVFKPTKHYSSSDPNDGCCYCCYDGETTGRHCPPQTTRLHGRGKQTVGRQGGARIPYHRYNIIHGAPPPYGAVRIAVVVVVVAAVAVAGTCSCSWRGGGGGPAWMRFHGGEKILFRLHTRTRKLTSSSSLRFRYDNIPSPSTSSPRQGHLSVPFTVVLYFCIFSLHSCHPTSNQSTRPLFAVFYFFTNVLLLLSSCLLPSSFLLDRHSETCKVTAQHCDGSSIKFRFQVNRFVSGEILSRSLNAKQPVQINIMNVAKFEKQK